MKESENEVDVNSPTTKWPQKYRVFGVDVSATHYEEAASRIMETAVSGQSAIISCHAAHALITFSMDSDLRKKINDFHMITPDGQPVRWALNLLFKAGLTDRVYGPELMSRLCGKAAAADMPIYLYGSTPEVIDALAQNLTEQFPRLQIAGTESPPFRELSDQEKNEMVARINDSGAKLVFIGLGCPKQDLFAHEFRDRINGAMICVGAAFDFHAGVKKVAPEWMQKRGLEWVFRLQQEPRRLWKRYLVTNTQFVVKLFLQFAQQRFRAVRIPESQ